MTTRLVKKFGGTSMGSIKKISMIAARLVRDFKPNQQILIVVSAMAGDTKKLINIAQDLNASAQQKEAYDMLLSSGEQKSVALLSLALEKRGIKTKPLLAHQIGILTNSMVSKASIQSIKIQKLQTLLEAGIWPIVAGFQGVTKDNQITTLGRGGSDLTAVALCCALGIDICEIFTDVEGVFTADPRLVPQAKLQSELTFFEMMEMSYVGSKVMQTRSVELAGKHNIKLHIRHAFKNTTGTWIKKHKELNMENLVISACAHDEDILIVKLKKVPKGLLFLSQVFTKLGKQAIYVDIISHSSILDHTRLSFSISKSDEISCKKILQTFVDKQDISIVNKVAKISIIGVGMASHAGVAGRFFSVLKQQNTKLYLVTTSEIKISAVIDKKDLKTTAIALHKEFKLDK